MQNWLDRKFEIFLVILSSLVIGAAVLLLAPLLTKNVLFLLALPFAGVLLVAMFLDMRAMFIFILFARSLLDPVLEKTRIGGGAGAGALLNLFVIVMILAAAFRHPKILSQNRHLLPWAAFLCVGAFTVPFAPLRPQAVKLLFNLTTYAAMFAAPFFLMKDEKDKKFWVKLLLFSSFVPVGVATAALVIKLPIFYVSERLSGTFSHANILAFYLVLMVAVVLYILNTRVLALTWMKRFLLCFYCLDLLLLLVVTQTRSAWISCAGLFVIYGLMKDKRFILACLAGILILAAIPQVQMRLKDLAEGTGAYRSERLNSMAWRLKLWESSLPEIRKKIILGHGLGSFDYLSAGFFELERKKGAPAHNVYVELLFEAGVLGLTAYLSIYGFLLKAFRGIMKKYPGDPSKEAAILFSYIIAYLLVNISDNALYYLAFNWYFWFFAGVVVQSFSLKDAEMFSREAAV